MAFAETASSIRTVQGQCPVKITLAGTVQAGDPLGYYSGWVLSVSTGTIQALLIAGEAGANGEEITAFPVAKVSVITTYANCATVGQRVAISDTGTYAVAASGDPDVGFVTSIGSDSLGAVIELCPMLAQLTVVRA